MGTVRLDVMTIGRQLAVKNFANGGDGGDNTASPGRYAAVLTDQEDR
jgi:hypothetical protein